MAGEPRILALVATRFRAELLSRLLVSLHHQTIRPLGAVVCDNGPDPATQAVLRNPALPCDPVGSGKNLGFGGGLAAAGRHALAQHPDLSHFLIVDDDARLAPEDLKSLLASANRHAAGVVAPFLVDARGNLQEVPEPVSWALARKFRSVGPDLKQACALSPDGYPMAWCLGPCLLVDRATWLRAGPPRADMLAYGDDVEFSLRLSATATAWAEPSVQVVHAPPLVSPGANAKTDHFKKFGMLLQNLAFTCVVSPRPRHLPLYLPGNAKRFLRTFGFTAANGLEIARRYGLGFLGKPAGK